MRSTDQRQAQTIALAIVERLETVGVRLNVIEAIELADRGRALIDETPIDWAELLTWNRRACDYLISLKPASGLGRPTGR